MTGDDLTNGIFIFLIGTVAVCIPAIIATLIRKYVVNPDPAPNVAANIILPPFIYLAGFFAAWGLMIYNKWDGSKSIEHLIIAPVSDVALPAMYAALVGLGTAIFSIGLPRNVKIAAHHANICLWSMVAMSVVMIFANADYEEYVSKSGSYATEPQAHVQPTQQTNPTTSDNNSPQSPTHSNELTFAGSKNRSANQESCYAQYADAINSAPDNMPLAQYAEINNRAQQKLESCIAQVD